MHTPRKCLPGILAALGLMTLAAPADAQKSTVYSGFAAIDFQGLVVVTGPESFRALSTMTGALFLDDGNGLLDTADVMRTSGIENGMAAGMMEGSGECVIAAPDGAQMHAIWTCKEPVMVGCNGDFRIVSGVGRHVGVTGGGLMGVETMETEIAPEDATAGAEISRRGFVI